MRAEDYVQLLGSPTTKQTGEYMDRMELLKADYDNYSPELESEFINVFPQENIFIPLADEVSGLRDYYYSWMDKENEYDAPLETVDFGLQIEKKSSHGYRYYNITWNMASTDPDALYTLVCYENDGDLYWPISTIHGNEDADRCGGYARHQSGQLDILVVRWCRRRGPHLQAVPAAARRADAGVGAVLTWISDSDRPAGCRPAESEPPEDSKSAGSDWPGDTKPAESD